MKILCSIFLVSIFVNNAYSEITRLSDPSKVECVESVRHRLCSYNHPSETVGYTTSTESDDAACVKIKYDGKEIYSHFVDDERFSENVAGAERAVMHCKTQVAAAIASKGYLILNGKIEPTSKNWLLISNKLSDSELMDQFFEFKEETTERLETLELRVLGK